MEFAFPQGWVPCTAPPEEPSLEFLIWKQTLEDFTEVVEERRWTLLAPFENIAHGTVLLRYVQDPDDPYHIPPWKGQERKREMERDPRASALVRCRPPPSGSIRRQETTPLVSPVCTKEKEKKKEKEKEKKKEKEKNDIEELQEKVLVQSVSSYVDEHMRNMYVAPDSPASRPPPSGPWKVCLPVGVRAVTPQIESVLGLHNFVHQVREQRYTFQGTQHRGNDIFGNFELSGPDTGLREMVDSYRRGRTRFHPFMFPSGIGFRFRSPHLVRHYGSWVHRSQKSYIGTKAHAESSSSSKLSAFRKNYSTFKFNQQEYLEMFTDQNTFLPHSHPKNTLFTSIGHRNESHIQFWYTEVMLGMTTLVCGSVKVDHPMVSNYSFSLDNISAFANANGKGVVMEYKTRMSGFALQRAGGGEAVPLKNLDQVMVNAGATPSCEYALYIENRPRETVSWQRRDQKEYCRMVVVPAPDLGEWFRTHLDEYDEELSMYAARRKARVAAKIRFPDPTSNFLVNDSDEDRSPAFPKEGGTSQVFHWQEAQIPAFPYRRWKKHILLGDPDRNVQKKHPMQVEGKEEEEGGGSTERESDRDLGSPEKDPQFSRIDRNREGRRRRLPLPFDKRDLEREIQHLQAQEERPLFRLDVPVDDVPETEEAVIEQKMQSLFQAFPLRHGGEEELGDKNKEEPEGQAWKERIPAPILSSSVLEECIQRMDSAHAGSGNTKSSGSSHSKDPCVSRYDKRTRSREPQTRSRQRDIVELL